MRTDIFVMILVLEFATQTMINKRGWVANLGRKYLRPSDLGRKWVANVRNTLPLGKTLRPSLWVATGSQNSSVLRSVCDPGGWGPLGPHPGSQTETPVGFWSGAQSRSRWRRYPDGPPSYAGSVSRGSLATPTRRTESCAGNGSLMRPRPSRLASESADEHDPTRARLHPDQDQLGGLSDDQREPQQ